MARFDEVHKIVLDAQDDFDKFYSKNNQAAGTRVRSAMQAIKELAQAIRKEVQEAKNAESAKKKAEAGTTTTTKKAPVKKAADAKTDSKSKSKKK